MLFSSWQFQTSQDHQTPAAIWEMSAVSAIVFDLINCKCASKKDLSPNFNRESTHPHMHGQMQ